FFVVILNGAPAHVSFGDPIRDCGQLLEDVHGEGSSQARLYFIMSPDVANQATLATSSSSGLIFPSMNPVGGGTMLNLPAVISSVLPSRTLVLLDAAQIAGSQQGFTFDSSNQATIEMQDTPTNNEVT